MARRGGRHLAVPMETAVRLHAGSHGNPEATVPRARQAGPRGPPRPPPASPPCSPQPSPGRAAVEPPQCANGSGGWNGAHPAPQPTTRGLGGKPMRCRITGAPPSAPHLTTPALPAPGSHRLGVSSTYCVPAGARAAGRPRKPLPQETQGGGAGRGSRAASQRADGGGARGTEQQGPEEEGRRAAGAGLDGVLQGGHGGAGTKWGAGSRAEVRERSRAPTPPSAPPEASWCWRPGRAPRLGPGRSPCSPVRMRALAHGSPGHQVVHEPLSVIPEVPGRGSREWPGVGSVRASGTRTRWGAQGPGRGLAAPVRGSHLLWEGQKPQERFKL